MMELFVRLQNLLHREEGQGLVEYALIIVLVAIAAIVALQLVGDNVFAIFNHIGGELTVPTGGS